MAQIRSFPDCLKGDHLFDCRFNPFKKVILLIFSVLVLSAGRPEVKTLGQSGCLEAEPNFKKRPAAALTVCGSDLGHKAGKLRCFGPVCKYNRGGGRGSVWRQLHNISLTETQRYNSTRLFYKVEDSVSQQKKAG